MNPKTMCMGCMKEKQSRDPVCPLCGYDESERRSPLVMRHRTLLADQYVVGKVLGKPGGFGITYLGWDTRLETMVAIKEYLPRDNAGRDTDRSTVVPHSKEDGDIFRYGLEAFLLEARTLAKFEHSNVVRVRTFFEANGTAYLVMDYYDGMSLESYLVKKGGKIPEKLAVNIMMPILDGLREVHEKGFLHRDIKPHNIYLTRNGKPILLDFGAARFAMGERSRSLSVLLTPGYSPYEQYHRKGKQGVWTDIYAAGATLYRMVIGKTPPEAIEREKNDDLIAPSKLVNVSRGFQAAVIKSLEMEPSRRQQSVREFQDMMFSLVDPEPPVFESQPEPPPLTPPLRQQYVAPPTRQPFQPFPPPPEPQQKSPLLKWVVIGILLTVGLFIAYSMGRKQEIPPTSPTVKTEPSTQPVAQSEPAPAPVAQPEPKPQPAAQYEPKPAPAAAQPEPAKREPQAGEQEKRVSRCISGDCVNGYGTYLYKSKKKYEGQWKEDKKNGWGIIYHENGQKAYEGQWKEDEVNGQGILYNDNGQKLYEGQMKEGKMNGLGIIYKNGKKQYEGQLKESKMNGQGISYHENGKKQYEGQFKEDKVNGQGISYYENGKKQYEGQWKNGESDGQGIRYNENGYIVE